MRTHSQGRWQHREFYLNFQLYTCNCLSLAWNLWLILADFAISQIAPDFVLVIRTPLSDFYKYGIKISGRCVCFSWCTLICTILSSFWNIMTFTRGKELFWRVYNAYCSVIVPNACLPLEPFRCCPTSSLSDFRNLFYLLFFRLCQSVYNLKNAVKVDNETHIIKQTLSVMDVVILLHAY